MKQKVPEIPTINHWIKKLETHFAVPKEHHGGVTAKWFDNGQKSFWLQISQSILHDQVVIVVLQFWHFLWLLLLLFFSVLFYFYSSMKVKKMLIFWHGCLVSCFFFKQTSCFFWPALLVLSFHAFSRPKILKLT